MACSIARCMARTCSAAARISFDRTDTSKRRSASTSSRTPDSTSQTWARPADVSMAWCTVGTARFLCDACWCRSASATTCGATGARAPWGFWKRPMTYLCPMPRLIEDLVLAEVKARAEEDGGDPAGPKRRLSDGRSRRPSRSTHAPVDRPQETLAAAVGLVCQLGLRQPLAQGIAV